MNLSPFTLEGRAGWLLSVVATVGSLAALGMAFRLGEEALQASTAARLLFPFSMLCTRWAAFWDYPLFLYFLQLPLYAVIITIGSVRGRFQRTVVTLGCVHGLAAIACFLILDG